MKDTQLYSQILGIEKPWQVTDVQVSLAKDEVEVTVDHGSGKLTCPKYGKACSGYDKRQRRRRHLDTCQLKTLLMAEVPRVEWMACSRLKPMQTTSKTLRNHLWGILNAVIRKVDNRHAESMISRIKTLKSRARGFRNRERFRTAIYFHLGGLQLYPEGIRA